jgi:plasmid stabilization system protein ParE
VAEVFAHRVFNAAERLEPFPLSGRTVPELDVYHLREVIIGSYRLIYRLEKEDVEILTLYHGARLLTDCPVDLE